MDRLQIKVVAKKYVTHVHREITKTRCCTTESKQRSNFSHKMEKVSHNFKSVVKKLSLCSFVSNLYLLCTVAHRCHNQNKTYINKSQQDQLISKVEKTQPQQNIVNSRQNSQTHSSKKQTHGKKAKPTEKQTQLTAT